MQVFQAVKDQMGDKDRPPHFSVESMPENEGELSSRNAYLLSFGIIPIWFPNGSYEYVEQILRLARNELRYRGYVPGDKRKAIELSPKKVKKGWLELFIAFLVVKLPFPSVPPKYMDIYKLYFRSQNPPKDSSRR